VACAQNTDSRNLGKVRNLGRSHIIFYVLSQTPSAIRSPSQTTESDGMAYKADFKTTFEPSRVIQPLYTGGSVALSRDGRVLATCLGEDALLSNLSTGEHLTKIEGVSLVPCSDWYCTDILTKS